MTITAPRRALLGAGLATLAAPGLLRAQGSLAGKTITLVVPSPAGGGTDFSARLVADSLGRALGATMVVENRPGGNDVVGLQSVLRAPADGTTLLCGYCATMTARPAIGGIGDIVPTRDFQAIGQITDTPQLFVTHPTVPANTLQEFIALAKQRPGEMNYASAGNGSMHHMGTEYLKHRAGMDLLHVPYRGTGETIRDLIAGRIQFYMNSPPPLTPLVRDGKLRALCVSSNERHPGLPDVPSAAEQGMPDLNLNVWFAAFAPRGVPAPIVAMLSEKLREVLADQAIRDRAFTAGALVAPSTGQQLADRVARETENWRQIARTANITAG
ncbi:Bug family tripartite tricarboxylate transporter substrate binding protein [Neoroseomonas soli]|uniref:Tripartite tricarboxylate transporter substrate binding protein n=1 Tax=Neoroseomonas soli TaxID=1081025 RepID=A0A9X9WSD2_9PROT|nr:tripartite tricarboxylate transporter substrate binding protein [Neoroseomonas soli]MBR0670061.1 tripartite tricarboxylate transporter substrate binding protein [Neoroseomonas soli]